MKVHDIIRKKGSTVITVSADITVKDALSCLLEQNVGSLVIVDGDKNPMGIITERDILQLIDGKEDWHKVPVSERMTEDMIIGLLDDDVEYIMSLMTLNRFRHVPILEDGRLAGIISIGDIVKAQLKNIKAENRHLSDYIMGKYPA